MLRLSKPSNSTAGHIHGYDYWRYVGIESPCSENPPDIYKWECVYALYGISCTAGVDYFCDDYRGR